MDYARRLAFIATAITLPLLAIKCRSPYSDICDKTLEDIALRKAQKHLFNGRRVSKDIAKREIGYYLGMQPEAGEDLAREHLIRFLSHG